MMNASNSYPRIRTDETIRENVSHGDEKYPFQYYLEDIWEFDFHCIDWHWHPEIEMVYVEKGSVTVFVGNTEFVLTQGDAIFINAQVIHRFESTESTIIPNIVFSPLLLASQDSLLYQKYVYPVVTSFDFQLFSPKVKWQKEIIETLKEVFLIQDKRDICELQTVQSLLKIWHMLFENITIEAADQSKKAVMKDQARLQIILQYIHENYAEHLSLEDFTQFVFLSKSSILSLFHEYVHKSPIDYVLHYRLKRAAILLLTTENTISYISQNTGFHNVGYFCRKFKETFQLTPSQYRNQNDSKSTDFHNA